jgi:hypothetical protein
VILLYLLVAWWRFRWLNILFIVLVSGALWLYGNQGMSSGDCFMLIVLAGLIVYLTMISVTKSIWLAIFMMSCNHMLITLSGPLLNPIFQRLAEF